MYDTAECRQAVKAVVKCYKLMEGIKCMELVVKHFSELSAEQIGRIAFLVGRHHTYTDVDGLDYQILLEADYIANASENGCSEKNVRNFIEKIMRTASGRRLAELVLCP